MKKTLTAAVMMALILMTGYVTPAAQATVMVNPSPIRFEIYTSYYEANNENGLTGTSFQLFGNGSFADFNRMFQPAAGMEKSRLMPDNVWDARYVIALVKRGEFTTNFTAANVVRDLDKLRISYDAYNKATPLSTNSSTLIVTFDPWKFEEITEIVVTENGKVIERLPVKQFR